MQRTLAPCPRCSRHVRSAESACPFCDAPLAASEDAPAQPLPNRRLSRAATFMMGATLAVAGCNSSSTGGDDSSVDSTSGSDVVNDPGAVMAAYGAAIYDANFVDATDNDSAPNDDGGIHALYGVPPTDP